MAPLTYSFRYWVSIVLTSVLTPVLTLVLTGCAIQTTSPASPALSAAPGLEAALEAKTVNIAPVTLEWSDHWIREQRRHHSLTEIKTLQNRYNQTMTTAAAKAFEKAGWQVDENASVDAYITLSQLRINAPDYQGTLSDLYVVDEFGSANFALALKQGEQTLAEYAEKRQATGGIPGRLTETNRGLNYRAFERAMRRFVKNTQVAITP